MSELTSIEAIKLVGMALHGERWQRQLAIELAIDERQIRRWVRGDALLDPSNPVFDNTLRLLERKINLLHDVYETLYKWHLEATSKQLIYDAAVFHHAEVSSMTFRSFCAFMKKKLVPAQKLGLTKGQFARALQGAWEKVHI